MVVWYASVSTHHTTAVVTLTGSSWISCCNGSKIYNNINQSVITDWYTPHWTSRRIFYTPFTIGPDHYNITPSISNCIIVTTTCLYTYIIVYSCLTVKPCAWLRLMILKKLWVHISGSLMLVNCGFEGLSLVQVWSAGMQLWLPSIYGEMFHKPAQSEADNSTRMARTFFGSYYTSEEIRMVTNWPAHILQQI